MTADVRAEEEACVQWPDSAACHQRLHLKEGHLCGVSLALTMQQVRGWLLATESGSGSGKPLAAGSSHLFCCLAPERDHCLLWLKGSNHFT